MCLSCFFLCGCIQWTLLLIWYAYHCLSLFSKLFHGFKSWNSLFQSLVSMCSIFMYSDHDIVASFLVKKPVFLLEDNKLKLQDDIFDEMRVPNTKVFTCSISLILFNLYFLNFDSNLYVQTGGYPVSRTFGWIKQNKGCVWGWSTWKWFKNIINWSKSNQGLFCVFGCKRFIPRTY